MNINFTIVFTNCSVYNQGTTISTYPLLFDLVIVITMALSDFTKKLIIGVFGVALLVVIALVLYNDQHPTAAQCSQESWKCIDACFSNPSVEWRDSTNSLGENSTLVVFCLSKCPDSNTCIPNVENMTNLVYELDKILIHQGKEPVTSEEYTSMVNSAIGLAMQKGDQLERQGEENYTVEIPIKASDQIYGFILLESEVVNRELPRDNRTFSSFGTMSSIQAFQSKDWHKKITWNPWWIPGVNWALHNRGTFTYGKNSRGYAVVNGVSASVEAAALWPWSPSDSKSVDRLDASVVRIIGRGTYTHVFDLSFVYHGYLDVEVNGTGDVRVIRASFDF
jgi:hypothetical protein